MSDIAIRVDHCILRPLLSLSKGGVKGLSKHQFSVLSLQFSVGGRIRALITEN